MAAKPREQLSQVDLRRLMKEKSAKKVESPFAKYDPVTGLLSCLACKIPIKNETLWMAHENGRQHQQAGLSVKSRNAATGLKPSPVSAASKRPADRNPVSQSQQAPKKPKNSELPQRTTEDIFTHVKPHDSSATNITKTVKHVIASAVPDNGEGQQQLQADDQDTSSIIPENFFDNPTKNIAQKQEREKKAQAEDEWSKFQKSIQEESHKSAVIIEEDDEKATKQKELDQIDEQMARWEKIKALEIQKEEAAKKLASGSAAAEKSTAEKIEDASNQSDDNSDDDLDFLDWRKKSIFSSLRPK
ncbi:hypothetical protein RvY_09610 [Ramazzottius varieornatus]|uniref:Zinc finger protein 830 n=1 Tax=Ramazzottius varieornatus TaxID=947166 RepID=A0A1D1VC44_RAMVA|nr:hypothetical protein RvY_09610 [Ramazzottius varieornatus]